jgi:ATP-binding cassette, subfamily C, bacterial EexD
MRVPDPTPSTIELGHERPLWVMLREVRRPFIVCAALSFVINIMMLASPLFMLQVYDRVLVSRSLPTLLTLTALLAFVFIGATVFDILKARILNRASAHVLTRMGSKVFAAVIDEELGKEAKSGNQPILDMQTFRQFATGPGLSVLFDLPWMPIYLLLAFLLHPAIGFLTLAASVLLTGLAIASGRMTAKSSARAAITLASSHRLFGGARRGAEVLRAMGLERTYSQRWQSVFSIGQASLVSTSDRTSALHMASKYMRFFLQSAVLAIGAALAIRGEMSAGSIIAASIIMARALQPVEQATGQWTQLHAVRSAITRLNALLSLRPQMCSQMPLPAPKGALTVEKASIAPPGGTAAIVSQIDFQLGPGEAMAIVGPSGSGKSTLARALAGVWPTVAGNIRLDGGRLDTWPREQLGAAMGYLPQDVELFAGTITENIARFDPKADAQAVVKAAERANVHQMILRLPNGYMTQIGEGGACLSGGQRQRIALARALYGEVRLIVLDEPNSNLDDAGEAALLKALARLRAEGITVVIVSHRAQCLRAVDKILVLRDGVQVIFGSSNDILKPAGRTTPNPMLARIAPANVQTFARAE